ncbi:hypothetical protein A3I34_00600 [Candidatus Jorgensenbacteria bacterium RIFCSPLOWO2_02_FULL_45_12]|uniref:Ribulose-phosphate 3-epimerase n=2 Tax=Candidatus Joergenseniibacteriota TaxID=1752739 RepID=A0A1F6BMR5_9BACT|nr:MAG: Ribulose-phosphate 3-epimerase [Candidatus Jorgensenbacteria bacterium GW2011_GWA2_45_9]OGG38168.1 MAG: hypothetical protein A3D55_00660 [Candidatus Jorgensenbacteria bacterium RIFCSPHIGHO2_02_FULL_45_20]OGG42554.1 MAG: hypothetical protein A3I34_00600 [Candidatus Jorgensenbacteria bacterium RIFCSPLOWO2_02_FULL_45_12]
MIVIPSLGCRDENCVRSRKKILESFDPKWVHIDVADGKFAPVVLWGVAEEFRDMFFGESDTMVKMNMEAHIMADNPMFLVEEWIAAGAERITAHLEAVRTLENLRELETVCGARNVELGIAVMAETPNDMIEEFCDNVKFWSVLAVRPGLPGGEFKKEALDKIVFLRERAPESVIEVDGGINEETGKSAKDAGADILVSCAFIFNSVNPEAAYKTLLDI